MSFFKNLVKAVVKPLAMTNPVTAALYGAYESVKAAKAQNTTKPVSDYARQMFPDSPLVQAVADASVPLEKAASSLGGVVGDLENADAYANAQYVADLQNKRSTQVKQQSVGAPLVIPKATKNKSTQGAAGPKGSNVSNQTSSGLRSVKKGKK